MSSKITIETLNAEKDIISVDQIDVSCEEPIWCLVEKKALKYKNMDGYLIRVKDELGKIIIFSGVETAIESISKCDSIICDIKHKNVGPNLDVVSKPDLFIKPIRTKEKK
jgi:hypothetical protein